MIEGADDNHSYCVQMACLVRSFISITADRSDDDDIFYCTVSTNTEIDCTALSG